MNSEEKIRDSIKHLNDLKSKLLKAQSKELSALCNQFVSFSKIIKHQHKLQFNRFDNILFDYSTRLDYFCESKLATADQDESNFLKKLSFAY